MDHVDLRDFVYNVFSQIFVRYSWIIAILLDNRKVMNFMPEKAAQYIHILKNDFSFDLQINHWDNELSLNYKLTFEMQYDVWRLVLT